MIRDLPGAEEHAKAALALARRWGQRGSEAFAASNLMYILTMAGRLEEARRSGPSCWAAATSVPGPGTSTSGSPIWT